MLLILAILMVRSRRDEKNSLSILYSTSGGKPGEAFDDGEKIILPPDGLRKQSGLQLRAPMGGAVRRGSQFEGAETGGVGYQFAGGRRGSNVSIATARGIGNQNARPQPQVWANGLHTDNMQEMRAFALARNASQGRSAHPSPMSGDPENIAGVDDVPARLVYAQRSQPGIVENDQGMQYNFSPPSAYHEQSPVRHDMSPRTPMSGSPYDDGQRFE